MSLAASETELFLKLTLSEFLVRLRAQFLEFTKNPSSKSQKDLHLPDFPDAGRRWVFNYHLLLFNTN